MNSLEGMFEIADIHASRIALATENTKHLFPITPAIIATMKGEDIAWIDLLINRFGKLQDLLGAKIVGAFLERKLENVAGLSMIDKLNQLERLGIIESVELW